MGIFFPKSAIASRIKTSSTVTCSPFVAKLIKKSALFTLATVTAINSLFVGMVWAAPAPSWDTSKAYPAGSTVSYGGNQWQANTSTPAGLAPTGVGDGSKTDRDVLLSRRTGFGRNATGGYAGATYHVNTDSDEAINTDSTHGSLRYALSRPEPLWIVFDGNYTIKVGSYLGLSVSSNKTIDGRGRDITLRGRDLIDPSDNGAAGLLLTNTSNVIIENITLTRFGNPARTQCCNNLPNAIEMHNSNNIWVDHNDLSLTGNKLISMDLGTAGVTISWNHFHDQEQNLQIGNQAAASQDWQQTVTIHHNYFEPGSKNNSGYRHPAVSYGKAHAYNNYMKGWAAFSMRSERWAQLYAENNIFEPGSNLAAIKSMPSGGGANDYCQALNVDINNPYDGSTITGKILAYASVIDIVKGEAPRVTKVEFYLDNVLKATLSARPYQWAWDTSQQSRGNHTLKVVAYDDAGRIASATSTVTVSDHDSPPPPPLYQDPVCHIDDRAGFIKSVGNVTNGAKIDKSLPQAPLTIFNPTSHYTYYAQPADTLLKAALSNYTGAGKSPWKLVVGSTTSGVTSDDASTTDDDTSVLPFSVSLDEPGESPLSGTIKLTATTEGTDNISRVQFLLDGKNLRSDYSGPYTAQLDTTMFTNGTHSLQAIAFDTEGNRVISPQLSVQIQN